MLTAMLWSWCLVLPCLLGGALAAPTSIVWGTTQPISKTLEVSNVNSSFNVIQGLELAFSRVNSAAVNSSINFSLTILDDGGSSSTANSNLQTLTVDSSVFATIAASCLNITVPSSSMLVAPFSPFRGLRQPFTTQVINVRASLDDEIEAAVAWLVAGFRTKVSLVHSGHDLPLTKEVSQALDLALENRNLIQHESGLISGTDYAVAADNVTSFHPPDAVFFATTASVASAFIDYATTNGVFPDWVGVVFIALSNMDPDELVSTSLPLSSDVYFTSSFPNPADSSNQFSTQYRTDGEQKVGSSFTARWRGLEAYVGGLLAGSVFARMPEYTTTKFVDAVTTTSMFEFASGHFRLGNYGGECAAGYEWAGCACNQGARTVHLYKLDRSSRAVTVESTKTFQSCGTNLTVLPSSERPLVFGSTATTTGVFKSAAVGLWVGIRAVLHKHNANNPQRQVIFHTYNDDYNPTTAGIRAERLLKRDKVFLLIGDFGSSTTAAVMEVLNEVQRPLVGPYTGAALFRIDAPMLVNIRASYGDEAAALVFYAKSLGRTRISVMYQADAYGGAGLDGVVGSVSYFRLGTIASSGSYVRSNDPDIQPSLTDIAAGNPDAVVCYASPLAFAKFVKAAKGVLAANTLYLGPSPAVSGVAELLGSEYHGQLADGGGILFTSVMPDVSRSSMVVDEMNLDMAALPTRALVPGVSTSGVLEGYLAARATLLALQVSGMQEDTTVMLRDLHKLGAFNVGDVTLGPFSGACAVGEYDETGERCGCNQGMRTVWFRRIDADGVMRYFGDPFQMSSCGMLAVWNKPACGEGFDTIELSQDNTAFQCSPCSRGWYKTGAQTNCLPCPAGQASEELGGTSCTVCAAGTYQDRTGQTLCFPCPVGTYTNGTDPTKCTACPQGRSTLQAQSSNVSDCVLVPCGPGEARLLGGSCLPCNPGTSWNGTDECLPCPAGTYQNDIGQQECKPCPAGTYNSEEGQNTCRNCGLSSPNIDAYSTTTGAMTCETCPLNSQTCDWNMLGGTPEAHCRLDANSSSNCFCRADYFGLPGQVCEKCAEGAVCCMCPEVAGCFDSSLGDCDVELVLRNLKTHGTTCPSECDKPPCEARCSTGSTKLMVGYGYWNASHLKSDTTTDAIVECQPLEACAGGPNSACAEGYTTDRCGLCSTGFYESEGFCKECPAASGYRAFVSVATVLVPLALAVLFLYNAEKMFRAASVTIALDWAQSLAVIASLEVPWPRAIRQLFDIVNVINFKLGILPLACVVNSSWDYFTGWYFQILIPLILVGFCILVWLICGVLWRYHILKADSFVHVNTLKNTLCICISVTYTVVTKSVFEFLRCKDMGHGLFFLQNAPSVMCHHGKWNSFLAIDILAILFWAFGIPAALTLLLYRLGENRHTLAVKRTYGSVYAVFRDNCWFWLPWIMFRKLLMIMSISLLPNATLLQMVLALMCLFASMVLNASWKPFAFSPANRLQFWCTLQNIVGVLSGIVLYASQFPNSSITEGHKLTISVLMWVTSLWAALAAIRAFLSEALVVRLWYRADSYKWAATLLDSGVMNTLLQVPGQHWAISDQNREIFFRTFPRQKRNQLFSPAIDPINSLMIKDKLHQLDRETVLDAMIAPRFRQSVDLWLGSTKTNPHTFFRVLRDILSYHRDVKIAQALSTRVNVQVVSSGGVSVPVQAETDNVATSPSTPKGDRKWSDIGRPTLRAIPRTPPTRTVSKLCDADSSMPPVPHKLRSQNSFDQALQEITEEEQAGLPPPSGELPPKAAKGNHDLSVQYLESVVEKLCDSNDPSTSQAEPLPMGRTTSTNSMHVSEACSPRHQSEEAWVGEKLRDDLPRLRLGSFGESSSPISIKASTPPPPGAGTGIAVARQGSGSSSPRLHLRKPSPRGSPRVGPVLDFLPPTTNDLLPPAIGDCSDTPVTRQDDRRLDEKDHADGDESPLPGTPSRRARGLEFSEF